MSRENTLRVLEDFASQCREACRLGLDLKIAQNINCVAMLGMGGSSLPGEIIKSCVDLPFPLAIIRDYSLPGYVNSYSQAFVVSYSGNTEEAISAYKEALSRKISIIGISCGGKLEELCKNDNVPHIKVPAGIQPRDAIGYQTIPILNIFHNSGLFPNYKQEMEKVFSVLEKDYEAQAKDLAKKLVGKIPIIYSSARLAAAARTWKISFNENSKISAFYNELPEINHNEMVGFSVMPNGNFYFIMLIDEGDNPRTKTRFEITKKLLEEKVMPVSAIEFSGSKLSKVFEALYLGKWVSYFLALEYGVDPEKVDIVEDLKKRLGYNKPMK